MRVTSEDVLNMTDRDNCIVSISKKVRVGRTSTERFEDCVRTYARMYDLEYSLDRLGGILIIGYNLSLCGRLSDIKCVLTGLGRYL